MDAPAEQGKEVSPPEPKRRWHYSLPFRICLGIIAVGSLYWGTIALNYSTDYDKAAKARAGDAAYWAQLSQLPEEEKVYRRQPFVPEDPQYQVASRPSSELPPSISDHIGASGALVTYYITASDTQMSVALSLYTATLGAVVLTFRPRRQD